MKCDFTLHGSRTFSEQFEKKTFEKRSKGKCIPEFSPRELPGIDSDVNDTEYIPMTDAQKILEDPSKLTYILMQNRPFTPILKLATPTIFFLTILTILIFKSMECY